VLRTEVEEILRFLSIVHTGSPRMVTQDITIGAETIAAGEMVMVSLPSANRDADFLADADVFNVRRFPGPPWPSVTASTTASGTNWPGWRCRWPFRRC
jgi:cytochrome P450